METISGYELKEFNRVYKEMDDLYHEIALKLGLSDSAFIILYALCEQGNGCLQKDICAQAFVSKQTRKEGDTLSRAGKRAGYAHLPDRNGAAVCTGKDCSGCSDGKQRVFRDVPDRKRGASAAEPQIS